MARSAERLKYGATAHGDHLTIAALAARPRTQWTTGMRRPDLAPARDTSPRGDHAGPAHPRFIGGSRLSAAGTPIGAYDTLIAGHALARGLTLVTNNTREFSRVPGLQVENWTGDAPGAL